MRLLMVEGEIRRLITSLERYSRFEKAFWSYPDKLRFFGFFRYNFRYRYWNKVIIKSMES